MTSRRAVAVGLGRRVGVAFRQKVRQPSVPPAATRINGRIPRVRAADIALRTAFSEPTDLPALATECLRRKLREVVVPKRLPVLPPAPLHHNRREDTGFEEPDAPGAPEVMRADVLPAGLAGLGVTSLACAGDPGVDRRGINVDQRLVDAARRHAPRYVIAGDYEGDNHADINDLADRLRPYAHRVIVVPHEPGEVDRVPDWATVGYSSPTQYAGTDAPIWEYRGRDVHVLGGTIEQSIEIQRHLGDDVVSFDCNSFHRSATQFAKWWGTSVPHWNRLPAVADADSAETAYRNTMLNVSYELRAREIVQQCD